MPDYNDLPIRRKLRPKPLAYEGSGNSLYFFGSALVDYTSSYPNHRLLQISKDREYVSFYHKSLQLQSGGYPYLYPIGYFIDMSDPSGDDEPTAVMCSKDVTISGNAATIELKWIRYRGEQNVLRVIRHSIPGVRHFNFAASAQGGGVGSTIGTIKYVRF